MQKGTLIVCRFSIDLIEQPTRALHWNINSLSRWWCHGR